MDKIDQRLNEMHKNWHAEYGNANTIEECEEIRNFYKPYLDKYESKYRILYQLLQQPRLVPTHDNASGMTPSLAALDDATSLKQREWIRSELGEDIPRQYSSIEGRLTLHTPRGEDMKLEKSLNVTPEGSLVGIPTVLKRETLGASSETAYMEFPNIQVETTPKESIVPKSLPGTKEASKAEVLASTQQFFATIDQRNINVPTENQTTSVEVHDRGELELTEVPTTTVVTATTSTTPPIPMDMTLIGTSSPRVSLLEGSPSCPTVTATCRPRTWMQQLTEGQISEPWEEENNSGDLSAVQTLPEDIPDELGHEWRVLHPFDLPGVRFPTDTTPSNQRCLAENDALVELFQTTEYLDEVPTWGQRDYRLYPPHYGDPFYRGRGRGRGGQGRREWLQGRQTERHDRGFAGGNNQNDTVRPQQLASTERPTPIRQEDEWSIPSTVERRNDMKRCQIASTSFPAAPPPTEERLFTDWSSEGSPRGRNNQHIQSTRSVESRRIEPATREPEEEQAIRHILSKVSTTPSVQVCIDQVGSRLVDRETNTSVVDVRPTEEEARADLIHAHSIGIQVPSASSELSSSTMNER